MMTNMENDMFLTELEADLVQEFASLMQARLIYAREKHNYKDGEWLETPKEELKQKLMNSIEKESWGDAANYCAMLWDKI